MSRPLLINNIKKKHQKLNKDFIEKIVDIFFQTLSVSLAKKKTIEIRGFGTFFIKTINEKYSARNPKTGEIIYVPKKNKIRFKSSKIFNKFLNNEKT